MAAHRKPNSKKHKYQCHKCHELYSHTCFVDTPQGKLCTACRRATNSDMSHFWEELEREKDAWKAYKGHL